MAQHWLRKHFELMYMIYETETQTTFDLNTETGEVKKINVKSEPKGLPEENWKN